MMVTAFEKPFASMFIASRRGVARLRLERHRAREPAALERIDRVGADIGADVDEHRIRREPPLRHQHSDGLVDLAALITAVPHQPGADHPVGRIDEKPHVAELAEDEMAARGERVHDGVAQHRPADQERFEHRPPQRAAAAAVGPLDLAPGAHCSPSPLPIHIPAARGSSVARIPRVAERKGIMPAGLRRVRLARDEAPCPRTFRRPSRLKFCPCRKAPAAP